MSEIAARMGLTMLAKLDAMLAVRGEAAAIVTRALQRAGIAVCATGHMDRASNYKLIVRLPDGRDGEAVKAALKCAGIVCGGGVYDAPCHLQPVFAGIHRTDAALATATRWCPRHVCPPITSGTSAADAERIGEALVRALT